MALPQGDRTDPSLSSSGDGLGERWRGRHPPFGLVEVLHLAPALASPVAELAVRARAARFASLQVAVCGAVHRVERDETGVRVVAEAVEGLRLEELLARLETNGGLLTPAGRLALAGNVIRAVGVLHGLPGGLAHGAVTPAHVVLDAAGQARLTDSVFGSALEGLQRNRESLWREFHLALPAAASVPRFDRRADVTQLGAVVLAIVLGRRLRADEYPRPVGDLVVTATADDTTPWTSALRMWLQQALQLHPRSTFASAAEAERAFAGMPTVLGLRRAGARDLAALLQPAWMLLA